MAGTIEGWLSAVIGRTVDLEFLRNRGYFPDSPIRELDNLNIRTMIYTEMDNCAEKAPEGFRAKLNDAFTAKKGNYDTVLGAVADHFTGSSRCREMFVLTGDHDWLGKYNTVTTKEDKIYVHDSSDATSTDRIRQIDAAISEDHGIIDFVLKYARKYPNFTQSTREEITDADIRNAAIAVLSAEGAMPDALWKGDKPLFHPFNTVNIVGFKINADFDGTYDAVPGNNSQMTSLSVSSTVQTVHNTLKFISGPGSGHLEITNASGFIDWNRPKATLAGTAKLGETIWTEEKENETTLCYNHDQCGR